MKTLNNSQPVVTRNLAANADFGVRKSKGFTVTFVNSEAPVGTSLPDQELLRVKALYVEHSH